MPLNDLSRSMDVDETVISSLEIQLENIFTVLSAANPCDNESESQRGLNDRHMASLLDACRQMDSWFIKKRYALCTYCPEYAVREEIDSIITECIKKERIVSELQARVNQYMDAIKLILDQVSKDLAYFQT